MDDPATWPLGRVLPVVRREDVPFPDLGLVCAGHGPTVFLVNLSEATPERLACCVKVAYRDFAEVLTGWRVD